MLKSKKSLNRVRVSNGSLERRSLLIRALAIHSRDFDRRVSHCGNVSQEMKINRRCLTLTLKVKLTSRKQKDCSPNSSLQPQIASKPFHQIPQVNNHEG
jgi:hypothetical protein